MNSSRRLFSATSPPVSWRRPALLVLLLAGLGMTMTRPPHAWSAGEFDPGATLEYVETEHFRIVYDAAEGKEVALHIAAIAEDVRQKVLAGLEVEGPPRYDILLFDNHDYANGSSSGYPGNTMRFYLTAPAPPTSGSSDISDMVGDTWFRILFTHEFAHAVHLGRFTGWTRWWKWLTHGHPFHLIYPGWFVEGYAVALETELTPGGRGTSATSRMFLRTDVLEDHWIRLGAWGNLRGWPGPGSRYLYGGAFLDYVAQRFGTRSLRDIIDAANANVPFLDDIRLDGAADLVTDLGADGSRFRHRRLGGLERAFQTALGIPLSEVYRAWRLELLRCSLAIQEAVEAQGRSRVRRLTFEAGSTASPAILPGGHAVVYAGAGDSSVQGIRVVDMEGGKPRLVLARSGIDGTLAVMPDGRSVVYSRYYRRDQPGSRVTYRMDLFIAGLTDGKEKRLTTNLRATDPAVGPDGDWIYAVARSRGATRIIRLKPDGTSVQDVFAPSRRFQVSTPAVSPDGRHLAFSLLVQHPPPGRARYTIGIVGADGEDFRMLAAPGIHREPVWIDGDHLLFSSDRSGIYNLYTLDLRTGTVRAVTNVLTGAFQPRVLQTSDGPIVVFRGYTARGFDIFRLDPTPEERRALDGTGPGRPVPDVRALWVARTSRRAAERPGRDSLADGEAYLGGDAPPETAKAPSQHDLPEHEAHEAPERAARAPNGHAVIERVPAGDMAAGRDPAGQAAPGVTMGQHTESDTSTAGRDAPGGTLDILAGRTLDGTALDRTHGAVEKDAMIALGSASTVQGLPRATIAAHRYHPVSGLRLLRLAPTVRDDEGAWSAGFPGGPTLGVEASVGEPTGRHRFYGVFDMGLFSRRKNYGFSYRNASLGVPVTVYAREGADPVDAVTESDQRYVVWERGPGAGAVVTLPWSRGMSSVSIGLGGGVERFMQFYALSPMSPDGTPDGLTGRSAGFVETLDFGWGQGNAWRSPSQGHFLTLGAGQDWVVYDPRNGLPGSKDTRWEVWGEYTGRKWLGRGVLDVDLKAGYRSGWAYRYLLGGFDGIWAVPGVASANGVAAPLVALTGVSLSQDLWRPEFPIGTVPLLFLSRIRGEVGVTAGAGWTDVEHRGEVAAGLMVGLEAFCFSLRNGMNFVPRAYAGIDLRTGAPTWWVSLGLSPNVYSSLLPSRRREGSPAARWGGAHR